MWLLQHVVQCGTEYCPDSGERGACDKDDLLMLCTISASSCKDFTDLTFFKRLMFHLKNLNLSRSEKRFIFLYSVLTLKPFRYRCFAVTGKNSPPRVITHCSRLFLEIYIFILQDVKDFLARSRFSYIISCLSQTYGHITQKETYSAAHCQSQNGGKYAIYGIFKYK